MSKASLVSAHWNVIISQVNLINDFIIEHHNHCHKGKEMSVMSITWGLWIEKFRKSPFDESEIKSLAEGKRIGVGNQHV